jgi:hypothetical protein
MSADSQHNRIIARAAQRRLKPLGCVQKGRSRTWIDDHGWWLGVIEFQPSGWSKGSYLNVGACWMWYAKDFLSFDDGYRVEEFQPFRDDEQFEQVAAALAERAAIEVETLRRRFPSLASAAKYLIAKQADDRDLWAHYNAGVAAGLVGDTGTAKARLRKVVAVPQQDVPWILQLKEKSGMLLDLADNTSRFRSETAAVVGRARDLLKLSGGSEAIDEITIGGQS